MEAVDFDLDPDMRKWYSLGYDLGLLILGSYFTLPQLISILPAFLPGYQAFIRSNITALFFSDFYPYDPLEEEYEFPIPTLMLMINNFPNIRKVYFNRCLSNSVEVLDLLFRYYPNLTVLNFRFFPRPLISTLEFVPHLTQFSNLRELVFENMGSRMVTGLSDNTFIALINNFPLLNKLRINVADLNTQTLARLSACWRLRVLHFQAMNQSNISRQEILRLIYNNRLESLFLNNQQMTLKFERSVLEDLRCFQFTNDVDIGGEPLNSFMNEFLD